MSLKPGITVHCIVKNEERFVWYALRSVLEQVDRVLVYDTGSSDRTVEVIRSIESDKIVFEEKGSVDPAGFSRLRQEQLERTETEWFLILDGDEIWPPETIREAVKLAREAGEEIDMIALRFYPLVDDVFTALDDSTFSYRIKDETGPVTIRLIRTSIDGLHVSGDYGLEGYRKGDGSEIADDSGRIRLLGGRYLHASHLVRSSNVLKDWEIPYRRNKLLVKGARRRLDGLAGEITALFAPPVPVIGYNPLDCRPDRFAGLVRSCLMPAKGIAKAVIRRGRRG